MIVSNDLEKLKGSRILITGATGMIGRSLVKYIEELNEQQNAGIYVIAHGRNPEKLQRLFKDKENLEMLEADITELAYDKEVDYIIHTASITGGSKQHVDFPMRTIRTAIDGTRRVLDLALKNSCKGTIFLSSLEAYGNTGLDKPVIKETDGGYIDTMNPRSSYPEGKRISECMFTAYAKEYGLRTMVARLTSSFGYGVAVTDNRFFSQFARSILDEQNIVLKSTGETVRNYCDTLDVAEALLYMLCHGESGEAYNVANMDNEISVKDVAQLFIDCTPGTKSVVEFDLGENVAKFGYNPTMRNVLDCTKLMELGWRPRYSVSEMIVHLLDSLRKERMA